MASKPRTSEEIRKSQVADAEREHASLPALVTPTLPTLPAIEGADAYLNRNPSMMVGRVVKPNGKTGVITHIDDETPVSPDTEFVVLTESIWCGWARLEEGQPAQYEGGLLFSPKGFHRPGRDELPDQDPEQWPLGKFDDQPADPWKEAVFVPMEERSVGELYTLQIVSKPRSAAIFATDGLLKHCQALMHRSPDMAPVIRLKMSQYESTRYGLQWKPHFQVVGKTPRASAAKPNTGIDADMNDEVGF
jgi:hypothetical protein